MSECCRMCDGMDLWPCWACPCHRRAPTIGPEVHEQARTRLGREAQLRALAEELSEAAAAVTRFLNNKGSLAAVREELVDVESVRASLAADLGTPEEWAATVQAKRARLQAFLARLEGPR